MLLALLASGPIQAQDAPSLNLPQALKLAKERNGTVRAAIFSYEASRARAKGTYSAFLPQLTTDYRYDTNRTNFQTGTLRNRSTGTAEGQLNVGLSYRILDTGTRNYNYQQARRSAEASELDALQTLRQTLFTVHQQYFDALRTQELLRVSDAQVSRTTKILEETIAKAEFGSGPRKDILQARADSLNARANLLAAKNRVTTAEANLKATIGAEEGQGLGTLERYDESSIRTFDMTLTQAIREGLGNRPDLISRRKRVDSDRISVRLAELDRLPAASLDASAGKAFAPDVLDRRGLVLQVNFPIFDGLRSDLAIRSSKLNLESSRASLVQSERAARAEIESAYQEVMQNRDRLEATKLALDAARLNYQAVEKARELGAATIIEILTANVTLVTAESNYVEALYDSLIADVRLRLAVGMMVPGE